MKLFMKLLAVVFIVGSATANANSVTWRGEALNCVAAASMIHSYVTLAGGCWAHYGACMATSWMTRENCGNVQNQCNGYDNTVKKLVGLVKGSCH